jgi:hypothetical protein
MGVYTYSFPLIEAANSSFAKAGLKNMNSTI